MKKLLIVLSLLTSPSYAHVDNAIEYDFYANDYHYEVSPEVLEYAKAVYKTYQESGVVEFCQERTNYAFVSAYVTGYNPEPHDITFFNRDGLECSVIIKILGFNK
ncbi:MAG: hypothetical protein HON90_13530 [Halobacteriovoraceae bacterium]|jgi:hypothetical protein|nr:hypothetical protein [Halobacteriovoraceae bacterium]